MYIILAGAFPIILFAFSIKNNFGKLKLHCDKNDLNTFILETKYTQGSKIDIKFFLI